MASTNLTIPDVCIGTEASLPDLPYPMSCGTAAYGKGSFAPGPSAFNSCCGERPVAIFPDASKPCWLYCNATDRSDEGVLYECIRAAQNLSSYGCEGHSNDDGTFSSAAKIGSRWGWVLVFGLLAPVIACQW